MSHTELSHHKVLTFFKYLWGSIVPNCLPETSIC